MKKKWIRLNQLPNDFWGDVFLVESEEKEITMATIRIQDGAYPVWYSQALTRWFKFRTDLDYRVMLIEYPKITEEDFEC